MASVHERRTAIRKLLQAELPQNFIVVSSPDHPLLIRSADLLIGGNGLTTALFTPSAEERRRPALLKDRFVLNRLALPRHTRCILIAESKDHALANSVVRDFAEIVEWNSRSRLATISQDRNFIGRHRDISPEIIHQVQQQYSQAIFAARLAVRISRAEQASPENSELPDYPASPTMRMRRRQGKPTIIRNAEQAGLRNSPLARFQENYADAQSVADIISNQTQQLYSLDNGVPYPRKTPLGIALVHQWPQGKRGSTKLFHAAAFGGWAIALENQLKFLPRFEEILERARQ